MNGFYNSLNIMVILIRAIIELIIISGKWFLYHIQHI